ncbi:MAG: ATP-binding protein [Patescibacteria group bacterium]
MLGKLKLTITRKVVGLALVVALVSMALAGSVMYLVVRHSLETQTIQNLHTIADIEEQRYGALLETGGAGAVREAAPPAFGATGETFVVRKDGSAAVSVTPPRFDSGTQGTELGTQALNAGEAVFPSVTDYRGNTVLAVTRQFAPGWGLVAKIDRAEAFAPVGVIRNIFLVLGATASILVLLLASFFGRVITHPVRGLTRAVRSFSRGNLRSRARVHSSDEIGELSETFNVMAEQLERAQHGLEAQVQEKTARLFENFKELRQEKRRLTRSKARTEAFLEAVSDGLVVVDRDGTIVMVNQAFNQMLGWRKEEAVGRHVSQVYSAHTEDGKPLPFSRRPVGRALSSGNTVRSDRYLLVRRDGSRFRMETSAAPIMHNGRVKGAVAIFRDISDRWALQQRQQQFVSTASHELRTPLTALMGYLSMARGDQGDTARFTDRAFSAAQRLGRLVEDLLQITRLDHNKLAFDLAPVDPASVIRGELETLRTIFERKEVDLRFENQVPDGVRIWVDRDRFAQVIVNLLDNALKYTPSGGKVSLTTLLTEKQVVIEIRDTGIGIKPENLKRVFEKFYREENELSIAAGGSGLGLAITKELVERQGGMLTIASTPEAGTTVRLTFKQATESVPVESEAVGT